MRDLTPKEAVAEAVKLDNATWWLAGWYRAAMGGQRNRGTWALMGNDRHLVYTGLTLRSCIDKLKKEMSKNAEKHRSIIRKQGA